MPVAGVLGWTLLGAITGTVMRIVATKLMQREPDARALAPPLVLEAVTAALFAALAWRTGPQPELLAYGCFATFSVPLAATDLVYRRLPNQLLLLGAPLTLALLGLAAAVHQDVTALLRALAGTAVLAAFYLALYVALPGQLGGGDIKLATVLGPVLSWIGWSHLLIGTLLGWLLSTVSILILHAVRTRSNDTHIPLAPYMLTGALAISLAAL